MMWQIFIDKEKIDRRDAEGAKTSRHYRSVSLLYLRSSVFIGGSDSSSLLASSSATVSGVSSPLRRCGGMEYSRLRSYRTHLRHSPRAGAVGPAFERSQLSRISRPRCADQCPRPISISVPTM